MWLGGKEKTGLKKVLWYVYENGDKLQYGSGEGTHEAGGECRRVLSDGAKTGGRH